MATSPDEPEQRGTGRRSPTARRLYRLILYFLVINIGFFLINLATRADDGAWWFQWPLIATAIALGLQAVSVMRDEDESR